MKKEEGYEVRGYKLGQEVIHNNIAYPIIALSEDPNSFWYIGLPLSENEGHFPSQIKDVYFLEDKPILFVSPNNIRISNRQKLLDIMKQGKKFRECVLNGIKQELKDCELYTKDGKEFDFNSIEGKIESLLEYYDNKRGVY